LGSSTCIWRSDTTVKYNTGQVFHTHLPRSPNSIIWYQRKLETKQVCCAIYTGWCLAEGHRIRDHCCAFGQMAREGLHLISVTAPPIWKSFLLTSNSAILLQLFKQNLKTPFFTHQLSWLVCTLQPAPLHHLTLLLLSDKNHHCYSVFL